MYNQLFLHSAPARHGTAEVACLLGHLRLVHCEPNLHCSNAKSAADNNFSEFAVGGGGCDLVQFLS